MARIQVLDRHTAELIAAGEVVERPSSVVKELLENSIDAGATAVTVDIRAGGTESLSITDNGTGIAREDVPTAFLRHATSKVRGENDLDAIGTLGFRGEALASIAAVAKVELLTRTKEELAGTAYRIEGGEEISLEDAGCPQGTTIVVRDLFYNVPARMKFLKKDVSEGNAAAGVVERLALSHPEISIRLIREGREELHTPGDGDLLACIYAVLGRDFSAGLLPVDYAYNGIHVHGYISKLENSRANRTMQHFFINGRYVKTRTAMAALEQAYKGVIMAGKFPACVLHMDMPPETVDANVHPAKIEVRFINEKPVFDAVYHGVRTAIESSGRKQAVLPAPKSAEKKEQPQQIRLGEHPRGATVQPVSRAQTGVTWPKRPPENSLQPEHLPGKEAAQEKRTFFRDSPAAEFPNVHYASIDIDYSEPSAVSFASADSVPDRFQEPDPAVEMTANPILPTAQDAPAISNEEKPAVRYLGELFHTYILAEMNGALYVIDKHAAHERILYEQLKTDAHEDSQLLLSPQVVALGREEYAALISEMEMLQQAGYDIEDFGGCSILVRAMPMLLDGCDAASVLQEIAGGFASGRREIRTDKLDWIYHSSACRAAVKAGDRSQPAELQRLAEQVLFNRDIRTCPHGRPVCIEFTRKELEKQFGRIV